MRELRNRAIGVCRQPLYYGVSQILTIILATLQPPNVLLPTGNLHAANLAAGQIERAGDRHVPMRLTSQR
jgi:hypothetical protein